MLLKPELTHYFTPLMDVGIWSVISHKSSELYLESPVQKAMQSSPGKGHRLASTSREKVLPPPLRPSHTGPVRPDSLENFNLLYWVLLLPLKSFIILELGSLMHLTRFRGKSMSSYFRLIPSNVLGWPEFCKSYLSIPCWVTSGCWLGDQQQILLWAFWMKP